ncbi:hypothetical protein CUT44_16045 [Streptomyces carminius]|uniref:AG1 protein n=1 Tax=Streptomyces carminius TaxID=2665496 RepID=A0A2M8LY12_9ACTN|nr:hypothetical protein [Streptomyces carminius]PJE96825.1 hypothetical protein CUT44_16045 [Streptomyces carminius]
MSFDEEWRQIQADVAERRTGTRLNQLDGDGGGTADLAANADDLGRVGSDAADLWKRLDKDGRHALSSTSSAGSALKSESFRTGSAMETVHDTWESQLKTLLDACMHISQHLDYSAAQHRKDEADISQSFTRLSVSEISKFFK